MTDAVETKPDPAVEAEATKIGWTPKEKFRGDPTKWVDAQSFLDRGHQIMPILRKTNERLEGQVSTQQAEIVTLRSTVGELREGLKTMTEFQAAEVRRQVDAQIAMLKADKKAAIAAGDREQEAEIGEQLDTLNEKKAELKAPAVVTPEKKVPVDPATPAWVTEFATENASWYFVDKRRTALFLGICEELKGAGMAGKPLLEKAKQEVEAMLTPAAVSKVEAHQGGGGGGPGGGASGAKTFADLPSEAKAIVASELRKMVGANKPFKTEAAWKEHYVKVYFENE